MFQSALHVHVLYCQVGLRLRRAPSRGSVLEGGVRRVSRPVPHCRPVERDHRRCLEPCSSREREGWRARALSAASRAMRASWQSSRSRRLTEAVSTLCLKLRFETTYSLPNKYLLGETNTCALAPSILVRPRRVRNYLDVEGEGACDVSKRGLPGTPSSVPSAASDSRNLHPRPPLRKSI